MNLLDVNGLSVRYNGALTIVDNVSFSLDGGDWLHDRRPQRRGKSTIVNAVSQGVPYSGEVRILGKDVRRYRAHELAKLIGAVAVAFDGLWLYGRFRCAPGALRLCAGLFSGGGRDDEHAVLQALEQTGMTRFADQNCSHLRGELQRTFLAQLFAQNPRVLLRDEPTNLSTSSIKSRCSK